MRRILYGLMLVLPAGCGWIPPLTAPEPGPPAVGVQDESPASQLKMEHCAPGDEAGSLLCGHLKVPEHRAQPGGRTIDLNVIVVPASGSRSLPALYSFDGGPGIAATASAV